MVGLLLLQLVLLPQCNLLVTGTSTPGQVHTISYFSSPFGLAKLSLVWCVCLTGTVFAACWQGVQKHGSRTCTSINISGNRADKVAGVCVRVVPVCQIYMSVILLSSFGILNELRHTITVITTYRSDAQQVLRSSMYSASCNCCLGLVRPNSCIHASNHCCT